MESSVLNFNKADFESMDHFLTNSGITHRLNNYMLSLETKVDLLMSTLHDAINQCVPKVKRREYPDCPWSTANLRYLKNIKDKAWKFRNKDNKRWFNNDKADFDSLNVRLYGEYMERMPVMIQN